MQFDLKHSVCVYIHIDSIQICFSLLRLVLFRKLNDFWTHGINYKLNATHSLSFSQSQSLSLIFLCCAVLCGITVQISCYTCRTNSIGDDDDGNASAMRKYIRARYFLLFGIRCRVLENRWKKGKQRKRCSKMGFKPRRIYLVFGRIGSHWLLLLLLLLL